MYDTQLTQKYQSVVSDEDVPEDELDVTDLARSVKRLSVGKPGNL